MRRSAVFSDHDRIRETRVALSRRRRVCECDPCHVTHRPQRVSLQGISGSGKTTLGRELARRHGLRHLETDALVHGPNWTETPDAELRELVGEVIREDRWVIDSDYRRKLGTLVLEHADTAVWLDLPLHTCLRRLWARTGR